MEPVLLALLAVAGVAAIVAFARSWMRLPWTYELSLPLDIPSRASTIDFPQYDLPRVVMVTGGCGFLGRHIVGVLTKQPNVEKIVVFDIIARSFNSERVVSVVGDLTSLESVESALRTYSVLAVIHTASPDPNSTDTKLLEAVNVQGTANVLSACRRVGVHSLVHTSTASVVWAEQGQDGLDEEGAPYPRVFRDAYSRTKAEAEQLVMEAGRARAGGGRAGLATVALRPHAIWGPGDQAVAIMAQVARAGRARYIIGDGQNVVDWTYVGNVVHAHLLALQTTHRATASGLPVPCPASGRAFFVTNGEPLRFWEFFNWVLIGLGYDTTDTRLPFRPLHALATAVQAAVACVNTARLLLGGPNTRPVSLTFSPSRLCLAASAHWYRIDAARRELGYAPLWNMREGLFLTLQAYAARRCEHPSAAALERARRGNLIALGLVADPEGARGATVGANDAFHDAASLPSYSAADIAAHCTRGDTWIVIRGRVYDITRYVDLHPGGDAILRHAGGDATEGFEGMQHPSHVAMTVEKYLIGSLIVDGDVQAAEAAKGAQ